MSNPIRVGIHGACGRMGLLLARAVLADSELTLDFAVDSPQHPSIGQDIGSLCGAHAIGVAVEPALTRPTDCIVDFSTPEAAVAVARFCAERQTPLIVATTGFTAAQRDEIFECHHQTPMLVASNLSLVVNVLFKLAGEAGRVLKGRDFDVEIVERHHRFKADAPSGTALRLAEIIEAEMGLTERIHGRQGITGERSRQQIGIHAVRTGDTVGEHTVLFSTLGETLELVHRGHARESYVKGAIEAIKFLVARKAGLYTMADVLGLD